MKGLNFILGLISLLVGVNVLIFFRRGFAVISEYDGLLQLLWLFKVATYVGLMLLLYCVLLIRAGLKLQDGRLAIKRIRVLCGVAFFTAVFNSLANAGLVTNKEFAGQPYVSWAEAKSRFFFHTAEQLFDVNLLTFLLIISLFLLSGFVRLAIQLKSENESFI